jgi:hypothetical protein
MKVKGSEMKIDFPSEGAASCYVGYITAMKFHTYLCQINGSVKALLFFAKPASQKTFGKWQVVEVLARLFALFAIFRTESILYEKKVEIENSIGGISDQCFSPRRLSQWLARLAGEKASSEFMKALGQKYSGAMVAFGYFQESNEATRPGECALAMFFRGSARYLPPNCPGADFIVPLLLEDGKVGLVLCQVKGKGINYLENNYERLDAMKLCNINGVFKFNIGGNIKKPETINQKTALQERYESIPTVRILINFSNLGGEPVNGANVFSDGEPFLVIQSDGNDLHILYEVEKRFFVDAIKLAGSINWEHMPNYMAHKMDPPMQHANHPKPFNPVYHKRSRDCDQDLIQVRNVTSLSRNCAITVEEDKAEIINASNQNALIFSKRPKFNLENSTAFLDSDRSQ